jgi:hypothetical protein
MLAVAVATCTSTQTATSSMRFFHYSDSNIHDTTLLQAYKNPLFMQYHKNQPFNKNMLRPCPLLDNPGRLNDMVHASGAKSTDLEHPEDVTDLCKKCVPAATNWAPVSQEIWDDSVAGKRAKEKGVGQERVTFQTLRHNGMWGYLHAVFRMHDTVFGCCLVQNKRKESCFCVSEYKKPLSGIEKRL